jgi:D-alanine-D-alanine ligase
VKPVHLGSSIGITKAKDEKELENAIEVALHYDDKILVEEGVEPLLEITLPIMGNDEIKTAECERPLNKTELFDFNDKYLSGGKSASGVNSAYSEIPANIGDELTKKIKELGISVYRTLGCTGIARVDFLVNDSTKEVFVNEVNTLPGSLYHHNWKKAGVSNRDLVLGLIQLGEERFAEQQSRTYAFKSDILNKVGGPKVQPLHDET